MDISHRAEKLEEAANNSSWDYIEKNLVKFLDSLSFVLEDITEFLLSSNNQVKNTTKAEMKKRGTNDVLKEYIPFLMEAVTFVDIRKIEKTLEHLLSFSWEDVTTDLLLQIKECISSYEYDKALPFIARLMTSYE